MNLFIQVISCITQNISKIKKWGCEDKKIKYLIKFKSKKLYNINEIIKYNNFFYIAPFKVQDKLLTQK